MTESDAKPSPDAKPEQASEANSELQADMRKALEMKKAADARKPKPPETQTAHEGMQNEPNEDIAPSGALEAEGFRPAFGRGGMSR
jgi:hypothetical protein